MPTSGNDVGDATLTPSTAIRDFVIVSTKGCDDVLVRLQSAPLLRGLGSMPGMRARLHNPRAGERLTIDPRTCILFHYNDEDAIAAVRAMEHSQNDIVIICLAACRT